MAGWARALPMRCWRGRCRWWSSADAGGGSAARPASPAVVGDGAEPSVLIQAHIARASLLVVATDLFDARKMVDIARALSPGIAVLARGDDSAEAELWRQEQLGAVVASDAAMARNELVEQIVALRGEPAVHGGHGAASQT